MLVLCVGALQTRAIVGASHEDEALAAHAVMILNRTGTIAGYCSAIVLSPHVVLTAAHCVPRGAALKVHFRDSGGAPVLLDVAAVERNPGFRPDAIRTRERSIDLALVEIAKTLPARFAAASLGEAGAVTPGLEFRLGGYGLTREGVAASSGQFRVAAAAARQPLSALLLWAEDATHGGTGACTGDSGGPVFATDSDKVVALIVWSAGRGTSQCGDLTQALWLAPQKPWIDGVLARWGGGR